MMRRGILLIVLVAVMSVGHARSIAEWVNSSALNQSSVVAKGTRLATGGHNDFYILGAGKEAPQAPKVKPVHLASKKHHGKSSMVAHRKQMGKTHIALHRSKQKVAVG